MNRLESTFGTESKDLGSNEVRRRGQGDGSRLNLALGKLVALGLLWLAPSGQAQERWALPSDVRVRTFGQPAPTLAYAVDRVVAELISVHALQATGEPNAASPLKASKTDSMSVVLGRPAASSQLAKWCRARGWNPSAVAAQADGYRIVNLSAPPQVVIVADTDLGVWYGACAWLDSLRDDATGRVTMPLGETQEGPELQLRFTRGLSPGNLKSRIPDLRSSLDWWARWRMNVTLAERYPDPLMREYLTEAHKRGIRVVRGLGVRNLCAADDAAVARCAEELKSFLQLGGDGVSALWDDLPHERCRGHCDRCRERFGTNSLPHEIVRVLEALADMAAQFPAGRRPIIVWCPPHYSENRYPELSDDTFFQAIGTSEKIRRQTFMYYCEFGANKTALLDRVGISNRVWWYNGMRTVYHVCHNWPERAEWKLNIPNFKSFSESDFARFEVGWKTGIGVRPDGGLIPVPETTWQDLHSVPRRYQGYYPCMDTHPYHAAISGLFAFAPARFSQAEADRVAFRAIFGPGSEEKARQWSDLYVELQVQLAKMKPGPAPQGLPPAAQKRLIEWRTLSRDLQSASARQRALLSPSILDSVFNRMNEAENSVEKLLNQAYAANRE